MASTPPMDVKLAPKCLFFQVLRYDIEFSFMRGTEKNLKIKIYPTCFEKVYNSLIERIIMVYFSPCISSMVLEKKTSENSLTGRRP